MAGVKWSDDTAFPDGNECQIGDIIVGLRGGANYKFDFPSDGIKDGNGNYLMKWATTGAAADNYLQFTNGEAGVPVKIESAGADSNVSIDIDLKGTGILDVNGLFTINGGTNINDIIDDDTMATATDQNLATSESIVAYIASTAGGAGGSDTELQFNNSGTLDGISTLTYNGANVTSTRGITIDGSSDEIQLKLQGNGTQTTNIVEIENSAAANLLTFDNSGVGTVTGQWNVDNLRLDGNTLSTTDTNGDLLLSPDGTGATVTSKGVKVQADSTSLFFGAGDDATIQYDGTDLLVNPQVVGSGNLKMTAGNIDLNSNNLTNVGLLDFATDWRISTDTVNGDSVLLVQAQSGNNDAELVLAPIGASTSSQLLLIDSSNFNNYEGLQLKSTAAGELINSTQAGSGTANALILQMNGTDVLTIQTDFDMSANGVNLKDLADPVDAQDALTLNYFDNNSPGAGGSDTEVQYNNAGSLAGISSLTYDGTNITSTRGVTIDGSSDEIQLKLQGHSTQTTNIFEIENSAASNLFTFDNSGVATITGQLNVDNIRVDGNSITSTDTNGDINLTADGSGEVVLDGVGWKSLTNGQLFIGNTGSVPAAATLTAGTGISISNGAGSITISGSGGGYSWTEVTGTSQSMAINNGYIANNVAQVDLTLPSTASIGDTVIVQGKGAGGWKISQNAGQTIHFGGSDTTTGVGGSLESTQQYDSVELLCITANTDWAVLTAPQGTLTVV